MTNNNTDETETLLPQDSTGIDAVEHVVIPDNIKNKKLKKFFISLFFGLTWEEYVRTKINILILKFFARLLVAFLAICCGITTAAALITVITTFSALEFLATGAAIYSLAAIQFLATTYTNGRVFGHPVFNFIRGFYYKGRILGGFIYGEEIDAHGESTLHRLSWKRLVALGIALVFCIGNGLVFGALTYSAVFSLAATFTFLSAATAILPPIAIILGIITFVCFTALLYKAFHDFLSQPEPFKALKNKFRDFFSLDPTLPQNMGKSPRRILVERVLTILLTLIFLALAGLGLAMTLGACGPGISALLLKIPHAIPAVVTIVSKVLTWGLGMVANLPFTIKNSVTTVESWFTKSTKQAAKPRTAGEICLFVFNQLTRVINAIGGAFISLLGAPHNPIIQTFSSTGAAVSAIAFGAKNEPEQETIYQSPIHYPLPKSHVFPNNVEPPASEPQTDIPSLRP